MKTTSTAANLSLCQQIFFFRQVIIRSRSSEYFFHVGVCANPQKESDTGSETDYYPDPDHGSLHVVKPQYD